MKFYHKLTYPEKFKRTLYAGIPLLLVSSIIIFILAPTTAEKITIPAILLVIWLIQLMYTFQKSKKTEQ
ncbi:hypothetical protein [Lysinibacillus sp. 3P01SB]|uniref:hypothetical protein n=1 Tax=Lysinibacillus sp. 3P01SB TaxID=3132284 RepID=UPI0039A6DEB0